MNSDRCRLRRQCSFFGSISAGGSSSAAHNDRASTASDDDDDGGDERDVDPDDESDDSADHAARGQGVAAGEDAPAAADEPPRREARPGAVEADLDDDEQLDGAGAEPGVMGTYLKAVFDRLHSEVSGVASRNAFERSGCWISSRRTVGGFTLDARARFARS